MKKLGGFTLAEVLITLGIIGVVAAITIPNIIQSYQKKVTIVKLKKFYTNINQAIKLAQVENGSPEYWNIRVKTGIYGTYDEAKDFYNKYIVKYLKTVKEEKLCYPPGFGTRQFLCMYMTDGSISAISMTDGADIIFYTDQKCFDNPKYPTRCVFYFDFYKFGKSDTQAYYISEGAKNLIEPYSYIWKGTREDLMTNATYGCKKENAKGLYCTKLLQYENWVMPADYPW